MDYFSLEFLSALAIIILIDLVLAGDNAIVIGLAARNVEKDKQKKVILWGTAGAIIIRIVATVLVVKLLDLPWLHLAGGLLLIWIAVRLLVDQSDHNITAKNNTFAAIRTIIVADAAMGIDNVLAIAGAAKGSIVLVILGLLVSIPIMIWGSTILIKWMDRFPIVIYIGAGVIAYTAANMITTEIKLAVLFEAHGMIGWLIKIVVIVGVIVSARWINRSKEKRNTANILHAE